MKYIKAITVPQEIQVWFQAIAHCLCRLHIYLQPHFNNSPVEGELESRGIDTVYSHTVMSILLHPDIEPGQLGELGSRVAAVECLRSATEQKEGLEALVDELCRRLNNHLHPESEEGAVAAAPEEETFNHRSPRELAQLYYAAFPALENSPQVQAQRVSWDGRHIIELHEREQQNAQCANWELMQEQQLRSKLDSPSLVAIWGRQTSAALETHIFDGFNSVWALSGEDKDMLKIPDDEETFKMEKWNEDTAFDNDVSSSVGLALARIVAKLLDKYNSFLAFFRDDMLFWNWAREESNEPILQAIGTNTEAFASENKPGMDKSTLFNAGQGDCMPEHPIDDFSNDWPGKGPLVEHPMSLEFGEIDDKPFLGSGNDYLAMGDFMIPADDGDEYWGRGFDPTQQFDFLDSDEDLITAEEPTAKCPAPLPPIGTRRKRTQMETTVTMSGPEENFGNTPGDTWHPTWIENLPRTCPDAEVSPIFSDISRKVANSFNGTGARPKERRMNFSSGSHGTSSESSFNLSGNTSENSSLAAMFPPIRIRSQDELDAAQWPWKLNSNGELTTVGPWLPLQVGSELSSSPVVRSGYLDALGKELAGEIDELLFNLFEITQPWFQEGSSSARGGNEDIWPLQQPNLGLALPSIAASLPVDFSPENQPSSASIKPPGFIIPSMNSSTQAPGKSPPTSNAHSDSLFHNHFGPSKYTSKYSATNGTADEKTSSNASFTGTFPDPDPVSLTTESTASSHIPPVSQAFLGVTEQVAHDMTPAYFAAESDITLANSTALATKVPATTNVECSGTSGAYDKNSLESNFVNCSVEAPISTIHDNAVYCTAMKDVPSNTMPDSTAIRETTLPITSSLQSIPSYTASSYSTTWSTSTSQAYVVSNGTTQADCLVSPSLAENELNSQVSWIHISEPYASEPYASEPYTSQSYTIDLTTSQSHSLPQSVTLPNCSLANDSQSTTTDIATSEISSKSSTNISSKPFDNIFHSYESDTPVSQTLAPNLSMAEAVTSSDTSLPDSSPSSKLAFSTAMSGSSTCATSISHPIWHNTSTNSAIFNCSVPPPLLSTSLGNINCGGIPWTFPWPPPHPVHDALPRPPAWHQHQPAPWSTHGPRAGAFTCNLPGHGNYTPTSHIRVSPLPSTRPLASTFGNTYLRLGPGPVPRPSWPTSWNPFWPGHGQLTWPWSAWLLPPLDNRSAQELISRTIGRPMQFTMPPAPWTQLRMRAAAMPPPSTQPVATPTFGQILHPPPHRPPAAAETGPYQGQSLAEAKTPLKPTADSLRGPWLHPPPPTPHDGHPIASRPGLLNIPSTVNIAPSASITTSSSLPVRSESTATHVTKSITGPSSRHTPLPIPRHTPKFVQGRCFKPQAGANPKITSGNHPPPKLPPRLATRLTAKLSKRPASTSSYENGADTSNMPEMGKSKIAVSEPCKDASQTVPEIARRPSIKTSKDPSHTVPEMSCQEPAKRCKDPSQAVSETPGRAPVADAPIERHGKALTKTGSTGHNAKGGSAGSSLTVSSGQWRRTPHFKSTPGVSSHSVQNSEQNGRAPPLFERQRPETFLPYSYGRRKKRR